MTAITKLLLSLFLYCFLSLNSVASTTDNTRYFTKIVGIISPFLDYKLTGEISKERAPTLNHYEVNFDSDKRIQTISYFHGEYPSNNSYFYAHEVQYEYKKSVTARRYFDINSKPKSMWRHYYLGGEIHMEKFSHVGNSIELELFDKKGVSVTTGLKANKFIKKPTKNGAFIQTQFDVEDNPVVLTNYFPFEKSLITIDKNEHLYEIINLNPESEEVENNAIAKFSHVIFNFDKNGNELGWKFTDTKGELVNRPDTIESPGYAEWTYKFDWYQKNINIAHSFEMSYFDKDGKRFCDSKKICTTRFEKDSFGEYSSQSFHNIDGELITDPELDFARVDIIRDEKGRRIENRYYVANGKLKPIGLAIKKFSYDDEEIEIAVELDANKKTIVKKSAN